MSKKSGEALLIHIAVLAVICGMLITVLLGHTYSRKVEQYISIGQKYYLDADYEDALDAFNAAIEISPRSFVAYEARAKTYYAIGDVKKAVVDYAIAVQYVADAIERVPDDIYNEVLKKSGVTESNTKRSAIAAPTSSAESENEFFSTIAGLYSWYGAEGNFDYVMITEDGTLYFTSGQARATSIDCNLSDIHGNITEIDQTDENPIAITVTDLKNDCNDGDSFADDGENYYCYGYILPEQLTFKLYKPYTPYSELPEDIYYFDPGADPDKTLDDYCIFSDDDYKLLLKVDDDQYQNFTKWIMSIPFINRS